MKLNIQHAQEFVRIMESPSMEAKGLEVDGNFRFGFKSADRDDLLVDPGIVAGLIQLKKTVERGQSPEETLQRQVDAIKKELKI